jgi:acetolactate synthase I/II/III large subunit
MHTAGTEFFEALVEAGVSFIFANLGSDHPPLVEAMAEARAAGRRVPELVTCPHEFVALSAAHGYAQVTGQAQAVLVHVDCGTQNLGGGIHNADKGRAPVLIFAGTSPFTQSGEMRGSRNEFIHWLQDVKDQRGIVRGYMRYDNELRTGRNIKQMVHRAMQFAHSAPQGPVYLMAAREVMEEEVPRVAIDPAHWQPVAPAALPPDGVEMLACALASARRPLVVASYLGRSARAVEELVRLCRRLGVGVLEAAPSFVNFPTDDPLHQGNQWNEQSQNPALAEADLILVLDSDVPWIPNVSRPADDAAIFHIDADPLKQQMPLWHIPATRVFRADAATALAQLNVHLDRMETDTAAVERRAAHWRQRHEARMAALRAREQAQGDAITVEFFLSRLRTRLDDDTVVLNEAISFYGPVCSHLTMTRSGAMLSSGAGSLGWNGGAAVGVKLACPEKTVIALSGDGSYMFSVPSTVHWMARQYRTPFLQVVFNNRGWKSPKLSLLAVHPEGQASRANEIGVTFDPPPDYGAIAAAAGGAFARRVERADEVDEALDRALHAVRQERRCAVLDLWLPHL